MIPLATGDKLATQICTVLSPFCEVITVAGSIRRRRAGVNDVDLVILPRWSAD